MATTYSGALTNATITATTLNTAVTAGNFTTSTLSQDSNACASTNAFCWIFTPTKAGSKCALIFDSHSTFTQQGTFSIAAGDLWAGDEITGVYGNTIATTNTSEASQIDVITFDSAKCLQDDGTILITVAGDSTRSMSLNYKLRVAAVELL